MATFPSCSSCPITWLVRSSQRVDYRTDLGSLSNGAAHHRRAAPTRSRQDHAHPLHGREGYRPVPRRVWRRLRRGRRWTHAHLFGPVAPHARAGAIASCQAQVKAELRTLGSALASMHIDSTVNCAQPGPVVCLGRKERDAFFSLRYPRSQVARCTPAKDHGDKP